MYNYEGKGNPSRDIVGSSSQGTKLPNPKYRESTANIRRPTVNSQDSPYLSVTSEQVVVTNYFMVSL